MRSREVAEEVNGLVDKTLAKTQFLMRNLPRQEQDERRTRSHSVPSPQSREKVERHNSSYQLKGMEGLQVDSYEMQNPPNQEVRQRNKQWPFGRGQALRLSDPSFDLLFPERITEDHPLFRTLGPKVMFPKNQGMSSQRKGPGEGHSCKQPDLSSGHPTSQPQQNQETKMQKEKSQSPASRTGHRCHSSMSLAPPSKMGKGRRKSSEFILSALQSHPKPNGPCKKSAEYLDRGKSDGKEGEAPSGRNQQTPKSFVSSDYFLNRPSAMLRPSESGGTTSLGSSIPLESDSAGTVKKGGSGGLATPTLALRSPHTSEFLTPSSPTNNELSIPGTPQSLSLSSPGPLQKTDLYKMNAMVQMPRKGVGCEVSFRLMPPTPSADGKADGPPKLFLDMSPAPGEVWWKDKRVA